MDADTISAESSQRTAIETELGTAAETRLRHFIFFYGQPSREAAAAIGAAKVFLEDLVSTGRYKTIGDAANARAESRYVVRIPAEGKSPIGPMNQIGEVADAQHSRSKFEITMKLTGQRSDDTPSAVGHFHRQGRSIFDFMIVSQSIIRCIRASSSKNVMMN
jgi:hypothetical protein